MRDPLKLLAYEAKRRPEIAEYVRLAPTLTPEQIDALPVPLPWYRQALKLVRQKGLEAQAQQLSLADFASVITYSAPEEAMGDLREWTGESTFLKCGSKSFGVAFGDLLWLPASGGIMVGTMFGPEIDYRVPACSRFINRVGRTAYVLALQNRANAMDSGGYPSSQAEPLADPTALSTYMDRVQFRRF